MINDLLIAFTIGLAGSSHCLVMCGGIAATIGHSNQPLKASLAYNFGRLFSYLVIGSLFGMLGFIAFTQHQNVLIVFRIVAGILIVMMGLYITRWNMLLVNIERLFLPVWKVIQPYATQSLQNSSVLGKIISGMCWGWLPCGLIYSTLTWAIATGHSYQAGLLMLAFGVGTLPAMLLTSTFSHQISQIIKKTAFKLVSGLLLIVYGLHTIYTGLLQL